MPSLHDSILLEDDSTTSELHRALQQNFGSFYLEYGKNKQKTTVWSATLNTRMRVLTNRHS